MFTGIIQNKCQLLERQAQRKVIWSGGEQTVQTLKLQGPGLTSGLKLGDSVAVNGVCLTATWFQEDQATFDVIEETLEKSNLGSLQIGDEVNIERSFKVGDEVGGHIVSGHIWCTASLIAMDGTSFKFALDDRKAGKYVMPKGFLGINGASLTVGEVNGHEFWVHLIPETIKLTTFGNLKLEDKVNIEIDSTTLAVVETIERMQLKNKIIS